MSFSRCCCLTISVSDKLESSCVGFSDILLDGRCLWLAILNDSKPAIVNELLQNAQSYSLVSCNIYITSLNHNIIIDQI